MIRCAAWVSWVPGGDTVTLFDDRDGSYHALNRSASAIWTALSEGTQPAAIGEAIAARHGASVSAVQRDVDEFVTLALTSGLLVGGGVDHRV